MNLKDVSVILLGHGSRSCESAEDCVIRHAQFLNEHRIFRNTKVGFIKQEPNASDVINSISDNIVFLVPMLMSEGFTFESICRNLKREFNIFYDNFENSEKNDARKTIVICKPIGAHDMMSGIIKQKAQDILNCSKPEKAIGLRDISLFLVGHGTTKDEKSRLTIEYHVRNLLREKLFKEIYAVYLEEEPSVSKVYEMAHGDSIVVVPFFATKGAHVCEDIPVLLGEDRRDVIKRLERDQNGFINPTIRDNKTVWLTEPVGCDLRIIDIIIRSVVEKICDENVSKLL